MLEGKITLDIDGLKPTMKALLQIEDVEIHDGVVAVAKADGEFTLLKYSRDGESFTVNRYGHYRSGFPALDEAVEALRKANVKSAEILCELYAVNDDGKPLALPDLIRYAKGSERKLENLQLGVWNLLKIDGNNVPQDYEWKLHEMEHWFNDTCLVYVLPWTKPKTQRDLKLFWKKWVEVGGYEGVVVRSNGDIFKVKPVIDVDAVIVAVNKIGANGRPVKGYAEQKVRSVKVALMDEQERFVVIGDCTIPDTAAQKALWKLLDYKVSEDNRRVWVQPLVVIQIRFNSVFPGSLCEVMKFTDGGYVEADSLEFWKMRHPRFIRFRTDKEVDARDLRLDQVEVS